MRKTGLTVVALGVGLLWLGEAHAARFETHDTDHAVPIGTVYDTTTKLLWEQKTESGIHEMSNTYLSVQCVADCDRLYEKVFAKTGTYLDRGGGIRTDAMKPR